MSVFMSGWHWRHPHWNSNEWTGAYGSEGGARCDAEEAGYSGAEVAWLEVRQTYSVKSSSTPEPTPTLKLVS